jgi:ribosomal protein S18 acetylase RimI-like enzyme
VIATVRDLATADVGDAARLHRRAFPNFFLSSLGEPFLVQLYRGFLADPSAVALTAYDESDQLTGLAVGTIQPSGFFRRLLARRWPAFAVAGVRAVVRHPGAAPRLIAAIRYRGGNGVATGDGALLSSICVDPACQGSGTGGRLLRAWMAEARRRGAPCAFLTTDAEHNDTVNGFYRSHGWVLDQRIVTRHGRIMNRYVTRLESA